MTRSSRLRVLLALSAGLAFYSTANACSVCLSLQNNPFELPHPQAIEIAVATRRAIDAGHIRAETAQVTLPTRGQAVGRRGWQTVQKLSARALVSQWAQSHLPLREVEGRRQSAVIHFVFVDTGETCGLEIRQGVLLPQASTAAQSDIRLVLAKSAFREVMRLGLARASQLGIVVVEGDRDAAAAVMTTVTPLAGLQIETSWPPKSK